MERAKVEYCECEKISGSYTENDDFGYWSRCSTCDRVIEDSYVYFNHYDGEDHCID